MDTAKLTAAVETLQEYCEQVRLVMGARGYAEGHANVDIGLGGANRFQVWVFSTVGSCKSFSSWDGDAFAAALAYAESLPPAHTPETIAATLGITPEGRVLHASDCATHNEPAMPNGPCDCGAAERAMEG